MADTNLLYDWTRTVPLEVAVTSAPVPVHVIVDSPLPLPVKESIAVADHVQGALNSQGDGGPTTIIAAVAGKQIVVVSMQVTATIAGGILDVAIGTVLTSRIVTTPGPGGIVHPQGLVAGVNEAIKITAAGFALARWSATFSGFLL